MSLDIAYRTCSRCLTHVPADLTECACGHSFDLDKPASARTGGDSKWGGEQIENVQLALKAVEAARKELTAKNRRAGRAHARGAGLHPGDAGEAARRPVNQGRTVTQASAANAGLPTLLRHRCRRRQPLRLWLRIRRYRAHAPDCAAGGRKNRGKTVPHKIRLNRKDTRRCPPPVLPRRYSRNTHFAYKSRKRFRGSYFSRKRSYAGLL